MRVDFGSHLERLSNEMCQMNTKIGCIAHRQSRLSGFASSQEHAEKFSTLGGGVDDDDTFGSEYHNEMTTSQ